MKNWETGNHEVYADGTYVKSQLIVPFPSKGFYPVEKERRIRPGENLQVTCDFDSSQKDHVVRAGHTHDDEMCNMCDEHLRLCV